MAQKAANEGLGLSRSVETQLRDEHDISLLPEPTAENNLPAIISPSADAE
ncbi:MAG: hypothetical protein GY852_11735 [bacterium]|nr:hypothetical protein [bacterium]